ncbi:AMP-binding protein [Gordonia sp. zg691]|uniref:AMP-binding protein n=1 Tax=Gordonia jinghuaiqii TaxID=2758710 RepID=UPI001662772A|nr:AMP-binding protein [Gordonia jinghuaiqii]MBD0859796.1 AMP-binding protein [Gordonia jinghuaiqii]
MTFASRLGRDRPGEVAVGDGTTELTWSEADDWLRPAVNALLAADLGEHRRVAILARNSVETLLGYVACTLAGTSAVAVNSHLTAPETAYILEDSSASVVLCDSATATVAHEAAQLSGVTTVVAWGEGTLPEGVISWSEWSKDDSEPPTDHAPLRTLVYTSGTTGRPKGVELPFTSWAGGATIDEHVEALAGNRMIAFGRHLVVGPMYHSGPLTSTRLFIGGAPVTVLGKFDAQAVLTAIERDRIGSSIMVPTHFQRLLALPHERRRAADLSSLQYVLQVGAKCPTTVKQAMIDWFGPIVWESYGASEVGTTCMISAEEWLEHPGSVGRSVPPFEAYIADEQGNPAPAGTEGPLWFRDTTGRGIAYTSGARSGSRFTLGEIGRMDADGYVWITDRLSDMVVSGGVNIYPAEVEQALMQLPSIADVACVGVPHEEMGEKLVALIVPTDPSNPPSRDEIDRLARELLAGYKIPKDIYLTDVLPRTAVGKLDKKTMRTLPDSETASISRLDAEVGANR